MIRHLTIWLLFLLYTFTVIGQDTNTCPTSVILALSRANTACPDLNRNQLCYGNGTINIDADTEITGFSQQGDVTSIESINTIMLDGASEQYSIVSMTLQANLLNVQEGRRVTAVMFGEVQITNYVDVLPQVTLVATGLLNVRDQPESNATILLELPLRSNLTAIGRAEEGGWFRVLVPNTDELGWVNQSLVNAEGDTNQLQIVDETVRLLRPFQIMSIETVVDDAPCPGTPESGVLFQTPNTDKVPVSMTINGATIELLGTILLRAQANGLMQIFVLNGQVEVSALDGIELAPQGSTVSVDLDSGMGVVSAPTSPTPYVMTDLDGVPINNLGYRINIAPPTTQDAITQLVLQSQTIPTPTPSREILVQQQCRHTLSRDMTAWAGPGTFYEAVHDWKKDATVRPVIRTVVEGVTWYLLREGGWINSSAVVATETCGEVPLSDVVEYPVYNTFELETCESTNGPIRAGQWLSITFRDGGWETYRDAENATRVDPGRITVDTERLYVYAGAPIQVAPDRFYRNFSAEWEAQAGTKRIIGQRLSYILSCDVTIPAGNSR